jgi:hypothetical protein
MNVESLCSLSSPAAESPSGKVVSTLLYTYEAVAEAAAEAAAAADKALSIGSMWHGLGWTTVIQERKRFLKTQLCQNI